MCVKCCLDGELSDGRKGNLRYKFRIPLLHEGETPSLSVARSGWRQKEEEFLCVKTSQQDEMSQERSKNRKGT